MTTTNTATHTPEPWKTYGHHIWGNDGTADGCVVCFWEDAEKAVDARHVVACVNHCAGLNPEAVPGLLKACEDLMGLIESGWLVRDTSQDGEPDYGMRQIEPVRKLVAAQTAIAKAKQNHP